jgi:transketolase
MPLEPLVEKWHAFNWHVLEINGHNMRQIVEALDWAEEVHDRPSIIIAHTTKGKGVSYMENLSYWHGIPPSDDQLQQALIELGQEA